MLEQLFTGVKPIYGNLPLTYHHWEVLRSIWKPSTITFENDGFFWKIQESVDGVTTFSMNRSLVNLQRKTELDTYGLLGVSLLNLQDKSVILTEGVSDYFTAKILCPARNVLGVTTLGGSSAAKKILLALFDSFLICSDSDSTGLTNSSKWKRFLMMYNKQVSIFLPPTGCKDITESFIFNLKMAYNGVN